MNYLVATPDAFAAANKASLDVLATLLTNARSRADRLAALNLEVLRATLEDSTATARSLFEVKQPQDLARLQQNLAKPAIDKFVDYSRSVFEIASEAHEELAQLIENQIAEANKTFADALAKAEKAAPAGSEPLFAGVKRAIAAANDTYAGFTQLVKQATDTLEANLTTAKKLAIPAQVAAPAPVSAPVSTPAPKRAAKKNLAA